jgi:hypothetical protein
MLRRLFIGLLVVGVSLSLSQALPVAGLASAAAAQDPAKITVYVTKTGERYHRDRCRHLARSTIAMTLKGALARGFGPCRVCKPPASTNRKSRPE